MDTQTASIVSVPAEAPRWGNAALRGLAFALLRFYGWRLDIRIPPEPRLVILGAPHTSNWDGVLGVAAIFALGIRVHWFGKLGIFRWPFRRLLIWLGGVPIDRGRAHGVVDQTLALFASNPQYYIGIAPEGTRSPAPKWKRGFHQIARAADVPILLAYFDYARKVVGTGPLLRASDNYAKDLRLIQDYYRKITPKIASNFAAEG